MATVAGLMAWPLAANAQQAGKLPTIGFLGAEFRAMDGCFRSASSELGWLDGRTVAVEYRWSEGRTQRYSKIAAELVLQKVDIIVTVGSAVPSVEASDRCHFPSYLQSRSIASAVALSPAWPTPGGNVTGYQPLPARVLGVCAFLTSSSSA